MGIILDLLEYIHVKSKSLLEYIHGNNFLDLGDGVGLSPSLGTRAGLCRMRLLQQ
jgi:hypothetical protein